MAGTAAAASKGAAAKNGKPSKLPRLGASGAGAPTVRHEEVEIPERGVSVVLQQPSVDTIIAVQERNVDEDNARESFDATVALVAAMLVEPEWGEDKLREEVKRWTMGDWTALQDAAIKLSGVGEEIQRTAAEAFPGKSD